MSSTNCSLISFSDEIEVPINLDIISSPNYIESPIKLTDPDEDLITFSSSSPPTAHIKQDENLITLSDSFPPKRPKRVHFNPVKDLNVFSDYSDDNESNVTSKDLKNSISKDPVTSKTKTSEESPPPVSTQVIQKPIEAAAIDYNEEHSSYLLLDYEIENAELWNPSIAPQRQTRFISPPSILKRPSQSQPMTLPTTNKNPFTQKNINESTSYKKPSNTYEDLPLPIPSQETDSTIDLEQTRPEIPQPSLKKLVILVGTRQFSISVPYEKYFGQLKHLFELKPRLNYYNQEFIINYALSLLKNTNSSQPDQLFNLKRFTTALFQYYFPFPNKWLFMENNIGFFLQHLDLNQFKTKAIVQICDDYLPAILNTYKIKKTLSSGVYIIFINKYSIAFFDYSNRYKKGLSPETLDLVLDDLKPLNIFNLIKIDLDLLKVKLIYERKKYIGFSWDFYNPIHIPYIHACFKSIHDSDKLFL
uniref:Uncharacterized protein n=1 Tax=Orbilia brochopaga TaxID=3140254 RepID=A0A4Y5MZS2_9PEZI|nr:hypothetical protein [Drechslerella brochopaga]